MPVVTRSKRKGSLDVDNAIPNKTRRAIKLVDVTNKKKNLNDRSNKSQIAGHRSCDSIFNVNNCTTQDESKVKPLNSSLKAFNSNSIQLTESQKSNEVLNVMRKVKKVLQTKFMDMADRLQLDCTPECLFDVKKCMKNHDSSILPQKPPKECIFVANLYIAEERHFQFFQYVRRNLIARNIFPGYEICLSIIKEIMKFKSKDVNFSTSFVLSELHNIFITILNKFPPCQLQDSYYRMFNSLVKIDGLPEKKPILPTLFDLLYDLLFFNEKDMLDESIQIDFNKNFYLWDMEHTDNSLFTHLSRNDRFNRVFMVLDLLVRILEYDTAMFFIKYFDKFASTVNQKKPLIYSLIWQGYEESLSINATVKKLITLFIAMNALNYPQEQIRVFSRLLNLIFNILNMCEYPDKVINYPIYNNHSLVISKEIYKAVESSVYCSMDLHLNVMNNIRSPLIRMLLANQIYSKIIGKTLPISLTVPYNVIYNRNFLTFGVDTKIQPTNDKEEKYPKYDESKKSKKCSISQSHFIRLMMLYTGAVIRYFHLHDIVNEIKSDELQCSFSDVEMKFQPSNPADFERELKNINLNEKVQLRSIDLNSRIMSSLQLSKNNCSFYKNEIKHFSLIIKVIKRYHEKYGSSFDEWIEMFEKIQKIV